MAQCADMDLDWFRFLAQDDKREGNGKKSSSAAALKNTPLVRCKDVRTVCGADWPQTKYYVYFTDHQLRDRLPHNRVVAVMPSRLH